MDKNCRIYVAGHRGLVGSALVRALRREGYENLLLRRRRELDLLDQTAVDEFFHSERPEVVFLAAARVGGIYANDTYPGEFIYENLMIQNHVLAAARECGVGKLVFLGSSCIYPKLAPQPLREEYLLSGPLEPTNSPYAVAKIAGIEMCRAFNRQYDTCFIPVMPTNLYGPGDNYDLMDSHVLPALIRKFHLAKLAAAGDLREIERDAAIFGAIPDDFFTNLQSIAAANGAARSVDFAGEPLDAVSLWGSGAPRREFLHVDDLAAALLFIVDHYPGTELVNIGVGEDLTIRELAELVREVIGYRGKIIFDATKPDGTPRKLLEVSRLKNLGWEALTSLAEGIRNAYDDYLARSNKEPSR